MMERYRARKRLSRPKLTGRSGTLKDVVAGCHVFSIRLKDKPIPAHLHVSTGSTAPGTVGLETTEGDGTKLVVKATGSALFGLVRREHRHTFAPGELERSKGMHTSSLRRSIKALSKGDPKLKDDLLARSLSLIHASEAVDVTFEKAEDRERLAEWIDAKWSVAMIQKSFKNNARITLALQGKQKTLNEAGLYDQLTREETCDAPGDGYGTLPVLSQEKREQLQNDLYDGLHVTHHSSGLKGFAIRGTPKRLRHDCQSEDGMIHLEPSFEGSGDAVISRRLDDLIQVGGHPSAQGPTAFLLRATQNKPEARESAVSLVFSDMSMDITCGKKENAEELVLYFSAVKGFTRAEPKPSPLLSPVPARTLLNQSMAKASPMSDSDEEEEETRVRSIDLTKIHSRNATYGGSEKAGTGKLRDRGKSRQTTELPQTFSQRFREGMEKSWGPREKWVDTNAPSTFGQAPVESPLHPSPKDPVDRVHFEQRSSHVTTPKSRCWTWGDDDEDDNRPNRHQLRKTREGRTHRTSADVDVHRRATIDGSGVESNSKFGKGVLRRSTMDGSDGNKIRRDQDFVDSSKSKPALSLKPVLEDWDALPRAVQQHKLVRYRTMDESSSSHNTPSRQRQEDRAPRSAPRERRQPRTSERDEHNHHKREGAPPLPARDNHDTGARPLPSRDSRGGAPPLPLRENTGSAAMPLPARRSHNVGGPPLPARDGTVVSPRGGDHGLKRVGLTGTPRRQHVNGLDALGTPHWANRTGSAANSGRNSRDASPMHESTRRGGPFTTSAEPFRSPNDVALSEAQAQAAEKELSPRFTSGTLRRSSLDTSSGASCGRVHHSVSPARRGTIQGPIRQGRDKRYEFDARLTRSSPVSGLRVQPGGRSPSISPRAGAGLDNGDRPRRAIFKPWKFPVQKSKSGTPRESISADGSPVSASNSSASGARWPRAGRMFSGQHSGVTDFGCESSPHFS